MSTLLLQDGREHGRVRVLLAHGAGAPMDSPFMNEVAQGLARAGIGVARFEFPYMAERRTQGRRRAPDRMPALQQSFRDAVSELGGGPQLVIGGKSMGGRVASMVADELSARGLLVFGYPFHPTDKPSVLRTQHLGALRTPALFVQGTRDSMGSREEVGGYQLSKQIELAWIEDGDHSLKPRRRAGHNPADALATAISVAAAFIERACPA